MDAIIFPGRPSPWKIIASIGKILFIVKVNHKKRNIWIELKFEFTIIINSDIETLVLMSKVFKTTT